MALPHIMHDLSMDVSEGVMHMDEGWRAIQDMIAKL